MLQYYLRMEPQLFKAAVEDQFEKIKQQQEEEEKQKEEVQPNTSTLDLALSKRMQEVKQAEARATIEDLMYVSVLEKFVVLGIDMLPRLDGIVDVAPGNLKALTEGIHSREALELLKEHLLSVMGSSAAASFSAVPVKMSKFQMAQVYAASIMFGYFLRQVDARFQLEKSLGTLPPSREEAVQRLERLFAMADSPEETTNPDYAAADIIYDMDRPMSPEPGSSNSGASSSSGSSSGPVTRKQKSALRRYVEDFDQATVVEMARVVSAEGAALVERQTSAIFGDIKKLTQQMQEVVGEGASSMEEAMQRMHEAIASNEVETLTMTIATQRRAVLEAVAYGSFLRDVETWVQTEYHVLTPLPAPRLPPGAFE